jgi:hypothetical protein
MEARNQMMMVSAHLSVKKVTFFKERKRRGSIRRDSIQPDGRRNQMKMVSFHLRVQKVTFFKEKERRGSTRRDSIQPDRSKKSGSSHLSVRK